MSLKELNSDRFYIRWVLIHSLLNIIGVAIFMGFQLIQPWLIVNCLSFVVFIVQARRFLIGYPWILGYANWVSISRLLLIIILGFVVRDLSGIVAFVWFGFAILLDGADGFVARRFKVQSVYGGRIDMETDAFLVLLLTLHHIQYDQIPTWILLPAIMRYLFGVLTYFVQATSEFTSRKFRATVAVVFFISLLTPFILRPLWAHWIVSGAGILILVSFGVSIYAIIHHRIAKS